MSPRVRPLTDADGRWVRSLVEREWGLPVVTPTGAHHWPERYEGVVAELDGERAGAALYVRDGGDWEIVTVIATVERVGVGRALLEEVRRLARASGAARVWLITTDDTGATSFYEHLGMTRTRTLEGFVDVVRRSKPLARGFRDAYELEWRLGPA